MNSVYRLFFAHNDEGVRSGYGLLHRFTPRNDEKGSCYCKSCFATYGNLDMATTIPNQNSSLQEPKVHDNLGMATITHNTHRHCEALKKSWQSRLFLSRHCEGRRPVAIHKKLKIKN